VNDVHTIEELERTLKTADQQPLQPATLTAIRTQGRRRRRVRATATLAGVVAATLVASVSVAALTGGETSRRDRDADVTEPSPSWSPETLTPLARRALAEIPGAVQISSTRVSIPEPPGVTSWAGGPPVLKQFVASGPFDIGGAHAYQGVTMYDDGQFPAWLEQGAKEWDERDGRRDDGPGSVIGSISSGVVVDHGRQQIACIHQAPDGEGINMIDGVVVSQPTEPDLDKPCMVSIVRPHGSDIVREWTIAAPDFLAAGAGVQLYRDRSSAKGDPVSLWVGGTDGTDVASVDLELADGQTVEATIASGTLVPGETVFWATVPGELVRAITRDADGEVLEDHPLRDCSGPVDCEVR
jgi:hypothetical protein